MLGPLGSANIHVFFFFIKIAQCYLLFLTKRDADICLSTRRMPCHTELE